MQLFLIVIFFVFCCSISYIHTSKWIQGGWPSFRWTLHVTDRHSHTLTYCRRDKSYDNTAPLPLQHQPGQATNIFGQATNLSGDSTSEEASTLPASSLTSPAGVPPTSHPSKNGLKNGWWILIEIGFPFWRFDLSNWIVKRFYLANWIVVYRSD